MAHDVRDGSLPRCLDDPVKYLDELPIWMCYKRYRFYADDIKTIYIEAVYPYLDPKHGQDCIRDCERRKHHALKALLVTLRRFSAPCDWAELQWDYGIQDRHLFPLVRSMVALLLNNHGWLLQNIEMFRPHFSAYAAASHARGCPKKNCVGYVDGTYWGIARPGRYEWLTYNGKYRKHGLKFQNTELCNGIIGHHIGPYLGMTHDATMFALSGF